MMMRAGFDTLTSFTCFYGLPRASRAMRFQGLRPVRSQPAKASTCLMCQCPGRRDARSARADRVFLGVSLPAPMTMPRLILATALCAYLPRDRKVPSQPCPTSPAPRWNEVGHRLLPVRQPVDTRLPRSVIDDAADMGGDLGERRQPDAA